MKFLKNLAAQKKQTIVAYGTSLTEGGSWVKELADQLDKTFFGLTTVINSGGSGQWSRWGVENLEERVLQKKPDLVFIEFSVNDSVTRFNSSVAEAQSNLINMTQRILKVNSQCEIILMTMTPADKHPIGHFSHRTNIESHYDMVRKVAEKHQFLLIDHYPNWKSLQATDKKLFDQYVPDSIHPTAEGNSKIVSPMIFKALNIL